MSIQSEWQLATKDEPAEFVLDYVTIKVQAVTANKQISVRLATSFDTDWQERRFDEWLIDAEGSEIEERVSKLYPVMKAMLDKLDDRNDRAELREFLALVESYNPGIIRA